MKTLLAALCLLYTVTASAQTLSAKQKLIIKLNSILKTFEGRTFSDGETLFTVKKQVFTVSGFQTVIQLKEIENGSLQKLKADCKTIPWASFSSFEIIASETNAEVQELTLDFDKDLRVAAVMDTEKYEDETNTITVYAMKKDFGEISRIISDLKKLSGQ